MIQNINFKSKQKAILFGIKDFDEGDSIPQLSCAISDVKNLQSCLTTHIGFLDEEVIALTSENDTLSKDIILSQLLTRNYLDSPQFLLIYISTHGILHCEKKQAYLIPSDVRVNKPRDKSPEIIKKTAISSEELMNCIYDINAQQTLLILDVCHSGAFGQLKGWEDGGFKDNLIESRGFESLQYFSSNIHGFAILASSKKEKGSYGSENGSIFTKHLIESLTFLSNNKEGVLLLRLVEHLQEKMEESPQTPIFKCDNLQNSHKWQVGCSIYDDDKEEEDKKEDKKLLTRKEKIRKNTTKKNKTP